eukprot:122538_1
MAGQEGETYEMIMKRLMKTFDMKTYVVLNDEAIPIKSVGLEPEKATHYAAVVSELNIMCDRFLKQDFVQTIIPPDMNELVSIRLKTRKKEIVIAPDHSYTLIAVDDPNAEEPVKEAANEDAI